MAVRCTWCRAPVGELCTTPSNGRPHRGGTHDVRRIDWAMTTQCPECRATPGHPCTTTAHGQLTHLDDVHPARTHTTHRSQDPP
ncbi:hypothetical protein SCWH03_28240 [Streptomyces pacificus]|uniref:DNA-binding phage zinc finger domain-containing protein n=2 Tax=Streptomyces TaxID=1883 RepID=A0A6A0AW54_9ACTN|nr:hypothetical protein SCWH03_28240 [Streptomyces pacificus]